MHIVKQDITMSEEPTYLRNMSLHISRTLDEIGLNKLTIRKRRRTHLYYEQMGNMYYQLAEKKCSLYHFGSQTEGATTPGLHSDLDALSCLSAYNVIEEWAEWERDKHNLLILDEDTAPGYCRLQLLRSDMPTAADVLLNGHYTYDVSGKVILKNTAMHSPIPRSIRNGPATTEPGEFGIVDKDNVIALKCRSWPKQAKTFVRRHRKKGWPTQALVEQATKHGVFIVPVGYKLSQTEHLEWRLSASLAERCLMFSLSTVHVKCYVVLKMLVKTFLEPRMSKSISSYHCKTAVLHCTEMTGLGYWRDDNLLQCITECLRTLLVWVTDGFCPHFIIPEENLFAGKVNSGNKHKIKSIFEELMKSNGRALLRVHMDKFGEELSAKTTMDPSVVPVDDSLSTVKLIGTFESDRQACISEWTIRCFEKNINTAPENLIRLVHKNLTMLKARLALCNKQERPAIKAFIKFLSGWLGSLVVSISLSHKQRAPAAAMRLIGIGATSDAASVLKLASVLYAKGDIHKVEIVLQKLEIYFNRNRIHLVCNCYGRARYMSFEFCRKMYECVKRGENSRAKHFAHCVRFSPQEIHCAPIALHYELSRSAVDDRRNPLLGTWMDIAVVDCLPFLYFLQYMAYKHLGKHDLQKQSLNNLDLCVKEDFAFSHLETTWNLLGQCRDMEQETEAALACYRTSLEIRPQNNAANRHIASLGLRLDRTEPRS